MRSVAILLLFTTAILLPLAHGQRELEELQFKYEVEREQLHKPLVTLRAQFKTRLLELQEKFMADGDLGKALAAKAAAEASDESPEAIESSLSEITGAKKVFLDQRVLRIRQKQAALKALNRSYRKELSELQSSLTKARKLEEAKAVGAVIEEFDRRLAAGAVPPGCVLHFSFDGKPNRGIVIDQSGEGHDGASADGAWLQEGFSGGGHRLVGGADRIRIAHAPVFAGEAATLACWVNLNSAPKFRARLWDKYDHLATRGYHFGFLNGKPAIQYCTRAGHQSLDAEEALEKVRWWHLVYTYDKSGLAIYLNGKLVASKADSEIVHLNNPVRMGKDLYGGHFPDANIDSVRFFSRRLESWEVESLYQVEWVASR